MQYRLTIINFSEVAPKFTKPLSDATFLEGDTAELTCEVNKEGATVKWFADAKENLHYNNDILASLNQKE
jgi:hypothetical protein